jgi:hypothetical protein
MIGLADLIVVMAIAVIAFIGGFATRSFISRRRRQRDRRRLA